MARSGCPANYQYPGLDATLLPNRKYEQANHDAAHLSRLHGLPKIGAMVPTSTEPAMVIQVQLNDMRTGEPKTLCFEQSPIRIGRNQLNNIAIEDPSFPSGTDYPLRRQRHLLLRPRLHQRNVDGREASPQEYDHAADWEYKADYLAFPAFRCGSVVGPDCRSSRDRGMGGVTKERRAASSSRPSAGRAGSSVRRAP